MKKTEKKYQCIPFWSWNDELDENALVEQIKWMNDNGVGGFFMHARGGLKTEYLGEKWFNCIKACSEKAKELGMYSYAYDENGWPSGFVGGKLLDDIENHDRYLTYKIDKYDENAFVAYDISGEKLKRINADCKNCLNVYCHYSASTADILNPEVVDKFMALTHEEYHKRNDYELKGFFTDEPQYYRWGMPYTKVLADYFKDNYDEDILDGLGLMFVEKEGYRAFRYKYWKAMQDLMLNNFAKKIYDWCEDRGYKLTGHYVEETSLDGQMMCCAGVMPFYEYEHIPGMDYLGRGIQNGVSAKQVGSVAAQLGKEQVITETYGCCGWNVTPRELKLIAETQYVGGVNLMCQHLLPFTEHGQRKRDYPAHYSAVNPWVRKNFKEFNDYFSVLGKILAESRDIVNVGVLHPIRSAYFNYKRYEQNCGINDIQEPFNKLIKELTERQIPYHFIDETLLAKYGSTENGKLFMGKCAYDFVILPKIYTMDKSTEKLLRKFVKFGGKFMLYDGKPEYLEGEKYDYGYLNGSVGFDDIISAQEFTAEKNCFVRTTLREDINGNRFIFAVNTGDKTIAEFKFKNGGYFRKYDILKDEYQTVGTKISFDKWESGIFYVSEEPFEVKTVKTPISFGEEFVLTEKPDNYITLDFIRYSTDGENYSEPLHHMGVFDEMLKRRYKGKLYLKYEFTVEDLPEKCLFLAENTNTVWVKVNGKEVQSSGSSEVEATLLEYDVAKILRKGKNQAVVCIDYYQSENVYYALFGENVTESLKNCLAYDTDIEAAYLKGDFGVYGNFEKGKKEGVILGENFYIGKQRKEIKNLITQGFPFFSGDIKLKQKLFTEDTDKELVIDKPFHLLEIKINGKFVSRLMFERKVDISKYLLKGENEIEITLTVGNRNLLGPFHTQEEEPWSIGPHTFERFGTWKEGKSIILNDKYAFVETIL